MNILRLKLLGVLFTMASVQASAQEFPSKPIRLVMPYAAGGAPDAIARRIAQAMSQRLGQPVVVDNKGGAGTAIGVQAVASAPADGYTILYSAATSFSINPHVYRNLPYRTQDFAHLGMIVETPLLMVSSIKVKATSVAEVLAISRRAPTEPVTVATNGKSGFSHLTAAMFYTSQSLPFIDVAYKGEGAVLPDMLSGQVSYYFGTLPGLMPHVESGRLKAYAVTSAQRSSNAPQIPTFRELGIPVEATAWFGLAAPKGIPKPAFDKLSAALNWALDQPEVRERLTADGAIVKKLSPADTEAYVSADSGKWGQLVNKIKAGGLDLQ